MAPGFIDTFPESVHAPIGTLTVFITGQQTQVLSIFPYQELVVGRQNTCDFIIEHKTCSFQQFRIYVNIYEDLANPKYLPLVYCEELGSRNGIYYNGHHIQGGRRTSILLTDGDKIEIKPTTVFKFHQGWRGNRRISTEEAMPICSSSQAFPFSDRYQISTRILGNGQFGHVFMAKQLKSHRQVVCKIINPKRSNNRLHRSKFLTQAKKEILIMDVLKGLRHPNIVSVLDVYSHDSIVYIFQELVPGGDLYSYLACKGTLPEAEAMTVAWQLLEGLQYLHGKNIVHRDLKPENILCYRNVPGSRLVLSDFGAASLCGGRSLTALGTEGYQSPEFFSESHTAAVDIWALGVVIYICLCGLRFNEDGTHFTTGHYVVSQRLDYVRPGTTKDAKSFLSGLLDSSPQTRMTAEKAFDHVWLNRHTFELHELYTRSIAEWDMEKEGSPSESEEPMAKQKAPVHEGGNDEEDEDIISLYTPEEQDLHDSVSGDGRLRNAAELSREIERRRAGNVRFQDCLSTTTAFTLGVPWPTKSGYFFQETIH